MDQGVLSVGAGYLALLETSQELVNDMAAAEREFPFRSQAQYIQHFRRVEAAVEKAEQQHGVAARLISQAKELLQRAQIECWISTMMSRVSQVECAMEHHEHDARYQGCTDSRRWRTKTLLNNRRNAYVVLLRQLPRHRQSLQHRGLDGGKPRHGLDSIEPRCSQPAPSAPVSAREGPKTWPATSHTAQPHNHHAAPPAICPASCGEKSRWLLV